MPKIKSIIFLLISCLPTSVLCSRYYLSQKYLDSVYRSLGTVVTRGRLVRHAFFSPDDQIGKLLVGFLLNERQRVQIAVYTLTDTTIAAALIDLHRKGIGVEIITDRNCTETPYSKINDLAAAGIPIYIFPHYKSKNFAALMHDKFIVFSRCALSGGPLLWTGSFNFTKSATSTNQENVVLIETPAIIAQFQRQFEIMKERCSLYVTKRYRNCRCAS